MEILTKKVSKTLNTVGWICLSIFFLFTIEVAFIFSALSMILWLDQLGGDPSTILVFTKAHFFLLRFALIMFLLGMFFWMLSQISKSNRERKEKVEQRRREEIQEVKNLVLAELKKSRRKR